MLAVGVDVGGTKLAAGLVSDDGTILARARAQTPEDGDDVTFAIAGIVRELTSAQGADHVPVGVGAAGLIDPTGCVRYAPNIAWADYPLRARLADALEVPVTLDNDANVAAWGEFCAGAAAGVSTAMAMLTIGTGVGGGLVLDGRLVRGAYGLAAEFGHMVVDEGGPPCACGNRGCLEGLAAGTAIGRRAQARVDAGGVPADSALHRTTQLTGKSVTVAAHAGDAAAREVIAECGFWLGVGIASVVNALDPEMVVVGGGAMQAGELLLGPARAAAAERLVGGSLRPPVPVVPAALGDDAGIIGAAKLALAAQG